MNDMQQDLSFASDFLSSFMEEMMEPDPTTTSQTASAAPAEPMDPAQFAEQVQVLSTIFGDTAVMDAMAQIFKEKLAEATADFVQDHGFSPVEADAIGEAISGDMAASGGNSGSDVGEAVGAVVGDELKTVAQMVVDNWRNEMLDESKRAFSGSGGQGGPKGGAPNLGGGDMGAGMDMGGGGTGMDGGVDMGGGMGGMGGMPMQGMPMQGMPMQGMPMQGMPMQGVPMQGMPMQGMPMQQPPMQQAANTPVEQLPAAERPKAGTPETAGVEPQPQVDKNSGLEGSGDPDKASESGGTDNTSAEATGNWLVVLASVLGSASGKHLKAMVDLGEEMGSIDSEADPDAFAKLNAEFQAESQIFKMFQEAISTMIKSVGEGMSAVARKS